MAQESQKHRLPISHRSPVSDTTAPDGSEIRLLAECRWSASRASLCEVTLPAGGVSRPVWHQTVEEIWYFLEGCGQVWRCPPGVEPESVAPERVGTGDALTIPAEWQFQFSADESGPLRFLCYTAPPWPGPDEARPAEGGGLGEGTV